jgi:pimeloyl-ACP methyl ester carboxylesterase
VSYSSVVALQMAADSPSCVHSLNLLEPPPVHVPSAAHFVAANAQVVQDYRAYGPVAALDRFLTRVIGRDWRAAIERAVPGAPEQMERDTGTFYDTDIPALLAWQIRAEDARRITQAVLHLGGSESGQFFAEVRDLMLAWLPQAEDVVLAGADHSLARPPSTDRDRPDPLPATPPDPRVGHCRPPRPSAPALN